MLLLSCVPLCGAAARVQKGVQSHSEGRAWGSRHSAPSGWGGRGLTGEPGPRAQTHRAQWAPSLSSRSLANIRV